LNAGFILKIQYGTEFPGNTPYSRKLLSNPLFLRHWISFFVPFFWFLVRHRRLAQEPPHRWLRNLNPKFPLSMLNQSPACPESRFKSELRGRPKNILKKPTLNF
jgi:hypothetical protein